MVNPRIIIIIILKKSTLNQQSFAVFLVSCVTYYILIFVKLFIMLGVSRSFFAEFKFHSINPTCHSEERVSHMLNLLKIETDSK